MVLGYKDFKMTTTYLCWLIVVLILILITNSFAREYDDKKDKKDKNKNRSDK